MRQFYLNDSYLQVCETTVSSFRVEKNKTAIVCEHNIFYPKGGGQPHDVGSIVVGDKMLTVKKVVRIDGEVWLFLDQQADVTKGDRVICTLDWERRFRNMLCHTAAHVVMSSIKRITAGFAADSIEIASDRPEVRLIFDGIWDATHTKAKDIIKLSKDLLKDNLRVYTEEFSDAQQGIETHSDIYRGSENPAFSGLFRLVIIEGVDANPCAGTHIRKLGEIADIELIEFSKNEIKIKVQPQGR